MQWHATTVAPLLCDFTLNSCKVYFTQIINASHQDFITPTFIAPWRHPRKAQGMQEFSHWSPNSIALWASVLEANIC